LPAGAAVDDLQLGDRPGGFDPVRQSLSATDGLSVDADDIVTTLDALTSGSDARLPTRVTATEPILAM